MYVQESFLSAGACEMRDAAYRKYIQQQHKQVKQEDNTGKSDNNVVVESPSKKHQTSSLLYDVSPSSQLSARDALTQVGYMKHQAQQSPGIITNNNNYDITSNIDHSISTNDVFDNTSTNDITRNLTDANGIHGDSSDTTISSTQSNKHKSIHRNSKTSHVSQVKRGSTRSDKYKVNYITLDTQDKCNKILSANNYIHNTNTIIDTWQQYNHTNSDSTSSDHTVIPVSVIDALKLKLQQYNNSRSNQSQNESSEIDDSNDIDDDSSSSITSDDSWFA